MPLTFQMIIFQTGTFWISIIAFFAFNEKIIPVEIIAMLICFAGMVTVTVSGSKNANANETEGATDESAANYSSSQLILGYSLIVVASWGYAACATLNRALKDINSGVIMFWHGITGIIFAVTALTVEYFLNDFGSGEGLHLFNMGSKVLLILLAATAFDTIGVNFATIAF